MTLLKCLEIINKKPAKDIKFEITPTYKQVILTGNNLSNILYDVSKRGSKEQQITYFIYE